MFLLCIFSCYTYWSRTITTCLCNIFSATYLICSLFYSTKASCDDRCRHAEHTVHLLRQTILVVLRIWWPSLYRVLKYFKQKYFIVPTLNTGHLNENSLFEILCCPNTPLKTVSPEASTNSINSWKREFNIITGIQFMSFSLKSYMLIFYILFLTPYEEHSSEW